MEDVQYLDDEITPGLSVGEVQSVARRQLAGSIVVAIMIAAVAGLTALKPASQDRADVGLLRSAAVQQPSFVTEPGQRVAALVRHGVELP